MAFIGIFLQIKLVFGLLVIQLVWYILKQSFPLVLVKVVPGYLLAGYLPARQISTIIIQQIVTLSKYGHDALDICHP